MHWIAFVVGVALAALVPVLMLVALFLRSRKGKSFTASAAAELPVSVDDFWTVVLEVDNPRHWPKGVTGVRWTGDDRTRYEIDAAGGTTRWEIIEESLPDHSIRRYSHDRLAEGIFEIHAEPSATGTRVTAIDHCQPTTKVAMILSLTPHKEATTVTLFLTHLATIFGRPEAHIDHAAPMWSDQPIVR